jgi:competence protein ComEA
MRKLLLWLVMMMLSVGTALAAINVNTANQKELESIKGIGPAKAKAIMDYRSKNGPFKSIEDLDKVKGVGKKTLAEIRPQVTLSGPSTPPAATVKSRARPAAHGHQAPAARKHGTKPGAGAVQPGAAGAG